MAQFIGTIVNGFRAEGGVNLAVKGIEDDKVIVAPTGPTFNFDKTVDGDKLTFTMALSSGTTDESRKIEAEVKNGSEKITPSPSLWEVEITSTSSPTEFTVKTEEEF